MKEILYINADGGGFAKKIQVEGETVGDVFDEQIGNGKGSDNYVIRHNRKIVEVGQKFQAGDTVSIVPK